MVILRAGVGTQHAIHGLLIDQRVHQSVCHIFLLRLQPHVLIGVDIELLHAQVTALCHGSLQLAPDTVKVLLGLQAICIRHRGTEIWFYGRLECTHFQNLHLHAHFFQYSGVVLTRCRQTVPIHCSRRVQVDTVSHRSHIVVQLSVRVRVGKNPLAGGLVIEQRIPNGLCVCRRHRERPALEIDSLNAVVVLCQSDIAQYIIEPDGIILLIERHRCRTEQFCEGVSRCSLFHERAVEAQAIYRSRFQFRCRRREHISHHVAYPSAEADVEQAAYHDGPETAVVAAWALCPLLIYSKVSHSVYIVYNV